MSDSHGEDKNRRHPPSTATHSHDARQNTAAGRGGQRQDSVNTQDDLDIPTIEVPKGGGALKSIDEKFQVNAANGTVSFSVPLPLSKTRRDFAPALSLAYNSGGGNSVFGLGWSLTLASIQRRTDKRLPEYEDSSESDVYILSGAEDMVPALIQDGGGNWVPDEFVAATGESVKRYRPRIEGAFSRIERVTPQGASSFYW
ncbi:MAG TPA: SpvB/TcaC N-terminal domain-containing protein, partial [Nitrospira sp.]|nr:SpvB/TcaC N-terminal domain-containing protein [Nitrospira sp.]